jgi:hypothetical protein
VWALVEAGDSEAVDVFVRETDARYALDECLRDTPDWRGVLHVEPFELEAADAPN